ncbi:MAG: response regulator [Lachnospiraceae bacterium]|nr:response regulator [Lachnospiraceae bacterium]
MLTVYIADDEVWITLGLKKLLEKSGYEVWVVGTANNGLTAKEEIGTFRPDVVFTDIRMPGLTGLELLREIPQVSPDTKVVMISGYAEFSYAQEAVQHHAYDYLLKPIKAEELDRVLKNLQADKGDEDAPEEENVPVPDRMIDQVIGEIRNHYTEDIQLTTLASKYAVSTGRLSTMIKEQLQMNFSDYVAQLRIQRAKELLRDDSMSIQEIAEIVGYNDYFYFTKVFKKVQGISPSKYRKSL